MRTGSKAFRKSKTHSEGKSRKGEEKCKKGREREKGEGEVRVPDRGGHASTQYETENPCLGSVMLEHRHRILCPKGYKYKQKHTQHTHTTNTQTFTHSLYSQHNNTLTHSCSHSSSRSFRWHHTTWGSCRGRKRRIHTKGDSILMATAPKTMLRHNFETISHCLPSYPKRIRSRSVLENKHSVARKRKGSSFCSSRDFCMRLSFFCKQLNGCSNYVCICVSVWGR